jgi:D-hydroxyproline dehydrogenase subunit beta
VKQSDEFDLIVVGAGIAGLAVALAGHRQGFSVLVIDRDTEAVGASIRNFGFVTVTGQGSGATWQRAMRSRDVWSEIAPLAGIEVLHRGLYVQAQRDEAVAVLHELLKTEAGQDLEWLDAKELNNKAPHLATQQVQGALYSPHEIRVEAREAIKKLRHWLSLQGVQFLMGEAVMAVETGRLLTTGHCFKAHRIVLCPGPDIRSLFPETFVKHETKLCQLQMLRVKPPQGYTLGAGVMSDQSLVRYKAYAEQPSSAALLAKLQAEPVQQVSLNHGIHLIIVQSADGSLVVGDSHHYGDAMPPFASNEVEQLILQEMQRMLDLSSFEVTERWTGIYPTSAQQDAFIEEVLEHVQIMSVTSGTGMSTSFALAEECLQVSFN